MKTLVEFGSGQMNFKLTSALLVYADGNARAATVHEIATYHGRPSLKPGQPISLASLEALITGLGRSTGARFISERVISLGLERVAWWCPAGRRRIWFKPNSRFDKSPSDETKRLLKLNGQFVHYPPLLFIAARGLSVFALVKKERPTLETRVWKAPVWNLSNGGMCNGNLTLPTSTADNIEGFERAFFDSAFTHNSAGGVLTAHPGGHAGLWEALAKRKTAPAMDFWTANLIRTKQTVKDLLK